MSNSCEFGCINLKTNTSHKGYIHKNGEMAYEREGSPFNPWEILASKNITWKKDISEWIWSSPDYITYSRLLILERNVYTHEKRAYYLEVNGIREYVDANHAQGVMGVWY